VKALASLLVVLGACLHATCALAGPPITVYYEERAPYQVRVGDSVEGLTGGPAAAAFKAAGVDVVWEASSISRQLHMLRENRGPSCVVGWFKTAERLGFAKYTKPIYRDGPVVALVRRGFDIGTGGTLDDTLATPELRVLIRGKYAYGPYIESALQRHKPDVMASAQPNMQLAELLARDRADLMFASEEEASILVKNVRAHGRKLQVLRFSDLLPGELRYIACSNSVADETIAKLNAAITFK
jgi:polar amino acid transport system substrate-binding protein